MSWIRGGSVAVFENFDLGNLESVLFSCGDYVEKIMTHDQFKLSKYSHKEEKSPHKNEVIESYFPRGEEAKSLKYSSYVDVSLDDIKLSSSAEPLEGAKFPLTQSTFSEESKTIDTSNPEGKLRHALSTVKLPEMLKITDVAKQHDMFFQVLSHPIIMQYVTVLFFAIVTLNALLS